jgi:hypothetical protein
MRLNHPGKHFPVCWGMQTANGYPNLYLFNCAVFSESGFLDFHEPEGHLTNGSLSKPFASGFSGHVISTLPVMAASAPEPFFTRQPAPIKIAVEGAEPELLRSLAEKLQFV